MEGKVITYILIVDDSRYLTELFSLMLERNGFKTSRVLGGKECLQFLKTDTPDLILLDIMMEPVDGWETLLRLKEDPATKDIPVMMETAKQITPEEAQKYHHLIDGFLMKPISQRLLIDSVNRVIERNGKIRARMGEAEKAGIPADLIQEFIYCARKDDVVQKLEQILQASGYMPDEYFNNESPRTVEAKQIFQKNNIRWDI